MNSSYDLPELSELCARQIYSKYIFERARSINILLSTLIIIVGLVGNFLAVFVFLQKKFRTNSASVYLLCLAMSDGLFLLTHFFEDTLRTYIDLYLNQNIKVHEYCRNHVDMAQYNLTTMYKTSLSASTQGFLRSLNITDRFDFFCVLFNYFRYFLRFISAYIIVAFTVHRAIAIKNPYSELKLDSKKVSYIIVGIISVIAIASNIWVPFFFRVEIYRGRTGGIALKYCDIRTNFQSAYFIITMIYILVVMFIPIIVIFVCNLLIITRIFYVGKQRKRLLAESLTAIKMTPYPMNRLLQNDQQEQDPKSMDKAICRSTSRKKSEGSFKSVRFKLHEESSPKKSKNQKPMINEIQSSSIAKISRQASILNRRSVNDHKINSMLMFMSFSYALLNLPYFITWMIFFHEVAFKALSNKETNKLKEAIDSSTRNNNFFSANYYTEIFYVLNYGIHFFIYCAAGKRFRQQLMFSIHRFFFSSQYQQKKTPRNKKILKRRHYTIK